MGQGFLSQNEALAQADADVVRPAASSAPSQANLAFIRCADISLSLVLLAIMAPLMTLLALVVLSDGNGRVFFGHRRLGQGGCEFRCYKFRTMVPNAEAKLAALLAANPYLRQQWERDHKLDDDPRVTRFGRFLRVSSLDELPQLWNVLRGDMSLVGPRPIVRDEVARYGRYIEHYFSVRPGVTGLWQISGRSDLSYRRRVALDVKYAKSRCIWLYFRIMALTVPAVITGRGSY